MLNQFIFPPSHIPFSFDLEAVLAHADSSAILEQQ
jgi:hypothetical protein